MTNNPLYADILAHAEPDTAPQPPEPSAARVAEAVDKSVMAEVAASQRLAGVCPGPDNCQNRISELALALAHSRAEAERLREALVKVFQLGNLPTQQWIIIRDALATAPARAGEREEADG